MTDETQQDFSWALDYINAGCKIASRSWNGKELGRIMYIQKQEHDDNSKMTVSYLYMVIKEDLSPTIVVPWTPSQKDLRMLDWYNIDTEPQA